MNNLTSLIRQQIINISNGDINPSDILSVMFQQTSNKMDIIFTNTALVSINPQKSAQLTNLIQNNNQINMGANSYTIIDVSSIEMVSPCLAIDNQYDCDSQINNYSCYWQNGQCHVDFSDDTTHCNHFTPKGEYYCPPNHCIWLNERCQSKISQNQTQSVAQVTNQVAIQPNNIKCEAINTSSDENVRKNECDFFNCYWNDNLKLCTDNINRGCELKNSKQQCLDDNINQVSSQNRCKWVENKNDNTQGYCMANSTEVPCQLYNANMCPTEAKRDVYGNILEENPCVLNNNDECVPSNNNSQLTCETHNYLGSCPQNDCKMVQINSQDRNTLLPTHKKNICVERNRLPCSALETSNCLGENANLCEIDNDTCRVKNINILNDINLNLRNPNLINTLSDYQNISGNVSNLLKNNNPITGTVLTNPNNTYQINNDIQNEIYTFNTSSRDSSKLTKGDSIILQIDNTSLSDTYKILSITKNQNIYSIHVNKFITIIPNNQSQTLDNLNWIVLKPVTNLYDSYSNLTSIKDSLKINNHFDSQFNL